MACGNNNVSRSYLSSQPSAQGARNGIAERLAAGAPRTSTAAQDAKTQEYRSVRLSPQQVKAAAEKRLAEAEAGKRSRRYAEAPQQDRGDRYYSKSDSEGRAHQFFNADSDLTFGRAHVHVIHDERNDEVRLHISLGEKNRHSEKIALVGASGNEVNAAVDLLTAELKSRMR